MNELINEYNNTYLTINLYETLYNARFYLEDNQLKIKLIDLVERDIMLKLKKSLKIVTGSINGKNISFFNFQNCGSSFCGVSEKFELNFRFDEFIENYIYTNVNNKKIKEVFIEFYDINEFTNNPFCKYGENMNPIFTPGFYNYKFNNKEISVLAGNYIVSGCYSYHNEKNISIRFKYNKCQKYHNILKDIFHFKAFLSLISKREIGIKKIEVDDNNIMYLNCIKFENSIPINEWLAHHYKEFILKLENIDNDFATIYNNFDNLLEIALPIFEIYFNILKYKTSDLNRFLNYTQILEYISKNFDNNNANLMWIKNGSPSGKITLSDRVESILTQVSFVWKFKSKKINRLSRKIADGRNYYNHHTNKAKQLTQDELFRIPYFLEDVILAYIYIYIGIDKSIIKDALKYNIFYDKNF